MGFGALTLRVLNSRVRRSMIAAQALSDSIVYQSWRVME